MIEELKERVLAGGEITRDEALALAEEKDLDKLCDAADEISRRFVGNVVDSCSIVNARSGMCGEDCKWCAQATRFHTGCKTYNFLDEEEVMKAAKMNEAAGIKRFSLVTSGRAVCGSDLDKFCGIYRRLEKETSLYLCTSMGLLEKKDLQALKDSGVKRYHCNLEASKSYFPHLCTTHTSEDKKRTIRAAREVGMQVCSGGIIGMGESMADRIDLALELRELDVDSVPINILMPVPGTPLEKQPLISEEEVIRTVAIFRFILPTKGLRFAGGRKRLSHEAMVRILHGGMNGALMGDMLTSVGNQVADDRKLFKEADMEY
jgi:biotin synthase